MSFVVQAQKFVQGDEIGLDVYQSPSFVEECSLYVGAVISNKI